MARSSACRSGLSGSSSARRFSLALTCTDRSGHAGRDHGLDARGVQVGRREFARALVALSPADPGRRRCGPATGESGTPSPGRAEPSPGPSPPASSASDTGPVLLRLRGPDYRERNRRGQCCWGGWGWHAGRGAGRPEARAQPAGHDRRGHGMAGRRRGAERGRAGRDSFRDPGMEEARLKGGRHPGGGR
jgi:hypothetical protein